MNRLAHGLILALITAAGCGQSQDLGHGCFTGETVCGNNCTETNSDPANCGRCGVVCGTGQVCAFGQCTMVCPQPLTECNRACVNVGLDPRHCGNCTTTCGSEQHCANAGCFDCPTGTVYCQVADPTTAASCAALGTDNLNCGRCGVRCLQTQRCTDGNCI